MEGGEEGKIKADEVISKLKDDGDFDRLRLKIIRLLKQNENVRTSITSAVKQSAALNCAGAETLTPRQLCDAIHDEISENVMNQISEALWEIIRSGDGMKTEITETVQSVYVKLLNPQSKTEVEAQSPSDQRPVEKGTELNVPTRVSRGSSGRLSNGERKKPPGSSRFSRSNHNDSRSENKQHGPDGRRPLDLRRESHGSDAPLTSEDGDSSPPGFVLQGKRRQDIDDCDEDPDIPPGFG